MKAKQVVGTLYIIWALIFAIIETKHFGNNMFPQSKMEWLCDITALLLSVAGYNLIKSK